MTGRGDDRRSSEGGTEDETTVKDDEDGEDSRLGWYVEKLLDLLSFF